MIDGFKKLVFITQKKSILQFNNIPLLHVSIKDNIFHKISQNINQKSQFYLDVAGCESIWLNRFFMGL